LADKNTHYHPKSKNRGKTEADPDNILVNKFIFWDLPLQFPVFGIWEALLTFLTRWSVH